MAFKKWLLIGLFLSAKLFAAGNSLPDTLNADLEYCFQGKESAFSYWAGHKEALFIAVGGVAALSLVDRQVATWNKKNGSHVADQIFSVDAIYSHYRFIIWPVGLYVTGWFFDKPYLRKKGIQLVETLFYTGVTLAVIKIGVGRRRPYAGRSPYFFKPGQWDKDTYQAFPSGHAAISWATATVMASVSDEPLWRVGWYTLATLVSAARIYHQKHWLSDVTAGALLGWFLAKGVIKKYDLRVSGDRHGVYLGLRIPL